MDNNYFIFNENKCVSCEACVVACVLENGIQYPEKWRSIFKSNKDKIPGIPLFNLSLACNHCEDAPCMEGCPALAFSRDSQTGAILIDSELCIGCRYCTWNCPYEAPKYNPVSNVVEKCNFCNSRISENLEPTCAISCPTGALDFSFDRIDKTTIRPVLSVPVNLNPSIVIHELEKKTGPEFDKDLFSDLEVFASKKESSIYAITELPLLIFTFIVACMVALSATNILTDQPIGVKISFIIIGWIGALVSTLHLGKKQRFWRSFLNIKSSWLSREIAFFSLFIVLSIIDLFIYSVPNTIVVFVGLVTLLSIDMVYKPLQWGWKTQWHPGQVIPIAISLFLLLINMYYALVVIMIFRIILTAFQSKHSWRISILRFILPLIALTLAFLNIHFTIVIIVFLLGEFIDRVSFYNDLRIVKFEELMDQA